MEARGVGPERAIAHAVSLSLLWRAGDLLRAPDPAWIADQVIAAIAIMENSVPTLHVPDPEHLAA